MNNPDIIVVGGGSAGCAMAARLAQGGLTVLLLEAGKPDTNLKHKIPALMSELVQNPQFDWKYQNNPDPSIGGRTDVWPAGKALGGGSSINGMMYVRGHRWDYDNWVKLGATGWGYDDLTPYFRRAENCTLGADQWRGNEGPIGVSNCRLSFPVIDQWINAVTSYGVPRTADHNGEHPGEGVDYTQVTQKNGLRSSATSYLTLPGVAEKLSVETEVQVRRVLIENNRAVGVEYQQNGQIQQVRSQHGVVMSAGGMGTPRLLMLSGIGPSDHLQDVGINPIIDLQGVGRNLQEHVGAHLVTDINGKSLNTEAAGFAAVRNGMNFLFRRRGILTTAIGHAQAFVHTRSGLPAPNIQLIFGAMAFDFDEQGRMMLRKGSAVNTIVGLSRPQARGRITLRNNNPDDLPIIDHQLLSVEDDVTQLAEGLEIAREIMAQPAISDTVTNEVRPGAGVHGEDLKNYTRRAGIPMYHPSGTCRMGTGNDAVVDANLKVHGIDGLWVADTSIIPTIPSGNTNATAIMIGDKGADHVLKTL